MKSQADTNACSPGNVAQGTHVRSEVALHGNDIKVPAAQPALQLRHVPPALKKAPAGHGLVHTVSAVALQGSTIVVPTAQVEQWVQLNVPWASNDPLGHCWVHTASAMDAHAARVYLLHVVHGRHAPSSP